MKTLAITTLAIGSLLTGFAQSKEDLFRDYIKTETIVAKNTGETFKVTTNKNREGKIGSVTYENVKDDYGDMNYYYIDGRVYDKDPTEVEAAQINPESICNAIRTSFTAAEMQKLKDARGRIIILPMVSNTGKVLSVFCLLKFDEYVEIPVERIATLQKKIKALPATVTDPIAKQLKYTSSFNMIFFKNL